MNDYIMHENCLDVCFEITEPEVLTEANVYIGYWVNVGYSGRPFRISDITIINVIDHTKWYVIDPTIKRTKPGRVQWNHF
jgi:hypothetical protein